METIRRVADSVKSAFGCDVVALTLVEPSLAALFVMESTDPSLRSLRLPLRGLAASIAGWNRGEVIPDAATDPRRDELVEKGGLRHVMCVPIRVKGSPRGTLIAARKTAGARPSDASDFTLLGLFADVAAIALAQIDDAKADEAFHQRLSFLASRSFDRWNGDDLDPALAQIAKDQGVTDSSGPDPVLVDICRMLKADAAAISAADETGTWRIVEAVNLSAEVLGDWSETSAEVHRLHREGRFSRVAVARGFGEKLDQDLRVVVRTPGGSLVLHVLASSKRGAFGQRDVRCAELAAVRLGWTAHAIRMEEELSQAQRVPTIDAADLEPVEEPVIPLPPGNSELDDLLPATWTGGAQQSMHPN